jgi:hypothetical protein
MPPGGSSTRGKHMPIKSFLLLAAITSLSACAPTVWDRPGTTPAEFSADVERCRLIAVDAKQKAATDETPDLLGDVVPNAAVSHTHARCMESKGYVASVSGAPRGSRTQTYRPVETANLVATADIEYYRGNSAADLLRFQHLDSKLAVDQDRPRNSYLRADGVETASAGVGLLADVGDRWRRLLSTLDF